MDRVDAQHCDGVTVSVAASSSGRAPLSRDPAFLRGLWTRLPPSDAIAADGSTTVVEFQSP